MKYAAAAVMGLVVGLLCGQWMGETRTERTTRHVPQQSDSDGAHLDERLASIESILDKLLRTAQPGTAAVREEDPSVVVIELKGSSPRLVTEALEDLLLREDQAWWRAALSFSIEKLQADERPGRGERARELQDSVTELEQVRDRMGFQQWVLRYKGLFAAAPKVPSIRLWAEWTSRRPGG